MPAPVGASRHHGPSFWAHGRLVVRTPPGLRPAVRWWVRVTTAVFDVDVVVLGVDEEPLGQAWADADRVLVGLAGDLPAGGYRLEITAAAIHLSCADLAGAHAGLQTLRQLAGPEAYRAASSAAARAALELPAVSVGDYPRTAWRGVLLDVARHMMPTASVLRFIDLAALHKLNVLQLHLTDDQGWRVQVDRYPQLTEVGAWRTESTVGTWRTGASDGSPHGGFYTRADLREIVEYARDRGIVVVPEIDVPGHVEAAIAAYPHLGTSKQPRAVRTTWGVSTEVLDPSPESLAFFRDVLDEVLEVFDSPWIGLGGDEVPTTAWRADPEIVARAANLGLADVSDLHGWFIGQLCEHVLAAGRRPVVWDEALSAHLPTPTVITSWRGFTQGAMAMAAGHDVVMAPEQVLYLDHRAGPGPDEPVPVGFVRTVEDVYAFDPMPAAALAEAGASPEAEPSQPPGRILGAQAQVWTEHLDSPRRVDFATYPRLAAFAEAVWSPPADRSPGSPLSRQFHARLATHHLPRLDAAGVEYRPLDGPLPWQTRPAVDGFPRDLATELAAGGWSGLGGWHDDDGDPQVSP